MDFLLNCKNNLQHLDPNIVMIISAISMTLAVFLAYFFSKKFIDLEIEKLEEEEITFFEKVTLLFSSVIMSVFIGGALISINEIGIMYFFFSSNFAADIIEKYVLFNLSCVSILVLSYAICSPNSIKIRIIKVSDELANFIFNQIYRVVAIVFFVCLFVFLSTYGVKDSIIQVSLGYIFGFSITAYYVIEIIILRKQITCLITIDKKFHKFLAAKLFSFFQEKLIHFLTLGALIVVATTEFAAGDQVDLTVFDMVEKIFGITIVIIVIQSSAHLIIDYFLAKIESIKTKNGKIAQDRTDNITDVCNTCVFINYTIAICAFLFIYGVHTIVLGNKIIITLSILFLTFIIHRTFKEFIRDKLDTAELENPIKYTKIKTFMPIIEIIFNSVLWTLSGLTLLVNLDVNIMPIIAAIMSACATLGIAAKNVVQSFLYGIVFLLEKDLYVGEYVEVANLGGYIEELGIRVFKLRDSSGCVHMLSYDSVRNITNYSKDYTVQTNELCIEASQKASDVIEILKKVSLDMESDPQYKDKIIKGITIFGLKPFDMQGIKIVWNIKTTPDPFRLVSLEFFKRLEIAFRKNHINIPVSAQKCIMTEPQNVIKVN